MFFQNTYYYWKTQIFKNSRIFNKNEMQQIIISSLMHVVMRNKKEMGKRCVVQNIIYDGKMEKCCLTLNMQLEYWLKYINFTLF